MTRQWGSLPLPRFSLVTLRLVSGQEVMAWRSSNSRVWNVGTHSKNSFEAPQLCTARSAPAWTWRSSIPPSRRRLEVLRLLRSVLLIDPWEIAGALVLAIPHRACELIVTCSRCRRSMRPERGTHHKQKRWRCPKCGRRRMQQLRRKKSPKS